MVFPAETRDDVAFRYCDTGPTPIIFGLIVLADGQIKIDGETWLIPRGLPEENGQLIESLASKSDMNRIMRTDWVGKLDLKKLQLDRLTHNLTEEERSLNHLLENFEEKRFLARDILRILRSLILSGGRTFTPLLQVVACSHSMSLDVYVDRATARRID